VLKELQEKMFNEMEQKDIFRQAQKYAFDYADNEKPVIRISICSWATTEDDIARSVSAFVTARGKAVQQLGNT
jgi:threonine aldolase